MAGRDKNPQEVMSAAMWYVKTGDRSELETFSLAALKKAYYQLSNRDVGSGYRRAIIDLINELNEGNEAQNKSGDIDVKSNHNGSHNNLKKMWHESFLGKVVVGLVIGVLLIFITYFINNNVLQTSPESENKLKEVTVKDIKIPIQIESTWDEYSDLDRKAEFYILRSDTTGSQSIIYSGSAKVQIPKNGLTVDEMISIAPYKTTKTMVILPKAKVLNEYLEEGGYEIQLVLFNKYGQVFMHMEQNLFDKEILKRGFRYWFRLMPKQIPNKSLNQDRRKKPRR